MIEKIGTIKNPLTIIAIFAGIAEISGTMILPFIAQNNQSLYIWFLMIFPLLLIALFFATLNFNHRVLYAPSDFKNENNFLQLASPAEAKKKTHDDIREIQAELAPPLGITQANQTPRIDASKSVQSTQNVRSRYYLAEQLVLDKIANEIGLPLQRNVRMAFGRTGYIFDGVIAEASSLIGIEVKYFSHPSTLTSLFERAIYKIREVVNSLPIEPRSRFQLILAAATDSPIVDEEQIISKVRAGLGPAEFPIEIRLFNLADLERDAEAFEFAAYTNDP